MVDFLREEKIYTAISRKLLENFLRIAQLLR
jgi:hypothetical protein